MAREYKIKGERRGIDGKRVRAMGNSTSPVALFGSEIGFRAVKLELEKISGVELVQNNKNGTS